MIAAGKDGRIYADREGMALFARLNTQLPNLTAEDLAQYDNGVILVESGTLAPDLAQIPKTAGEKMDAMRAGVTPGTIAQSVGGAAVGVAKDAAGTVASAAGTVASAAGQAVEGAAGLAGKAAGAAVEGLTGIPAKWLLIGGAAMIVLILAR